MQLNVDQQSYGEQSITDARDNVTKNCEQYTTKTQKIIERTKSMMKESSEEFKKKQNTTCRNDTLRRLACQDSQNARGMARGLKANVKRI